MISRTLLLAFAAVVSLAGSPAAAQQVLPPGQIDASGNLKMGPVTLGKRQGTKFTITPDNLQIKDPGSTGPVDGMTVAGRPFSSFISGAGGKTTLTPDAITGDGTAVSVRPAGEPATMPLDSWLGEEKHAADYVQAGDTGFSQAINRAIAAAGSSGRVRVPPGTYANAGDILVKQVGRVGGAGGHLLLDMRGVILTGTGNLIIDSSKSVTVIGLDAKGYTLSVRGMWNSHVLDCNFDIIAFGNVAGTDYSENYWNTFDNVGVSAVRFYTESNQISFRGPRFRGDAQQGWATARAYAIEFLSNVNVQALRVYGGDVSYYSQGIYNVGPSNTSGDVDLIFEGGTYFDTLTPAPWGGRRNVRVRTDGAFAAQPRSLTSATMAAAAMSEQEHWSALGDDGWRAAADVNLIGNGDLSLSLPSYVGPNLPIDGTSGAVVTEKNDAGLFGRYLNINQSAASNNIIYFKVASVPYTARYSGSWRVRIAGGAAGTKNLQFGIGDQYFVTQITGEWTWVAWSPAASVTAGQQVVMTINTNDGTAFNIDMEYVGVTLGTRPSLFARSRPRPVVVGTAAVGAITVNPSSSSGIYYINMPGLRPGDGISLSYSVAGGLSLMQLFGEVTGDGQQVQVVIYNPYGNARTVAAGNIIARSVPIQQ